MGHVGTCPAPHPSGGPAWWPPPDPTPTTQRALAVSRMNYFWTFRKLLLVPDGGLFGARRLPVIQLTLIPFQRLPSSSLEESIFFLCHINSQGCASLCFTWEGRFRAIAKTKHQTGRSQFREAGVERTDSHCVWRMLHIN